MSASDPIPKVQTGVDANGDAVFQRQMTEEQVRERAEMNLSVTSTRMRLHALATANGHSHLLIEPGRLTT